MNVRDYLDILHVAERLKDTPRHCTTAKRRTESVAEHSWRISLMAFLLRNAFPDADMDNVIRMCLIHDLGECFTGDIPTFSKTDDDRDIEDSLLKQWVNTLPGEISKEMKKLYAEMDAQDTVESKIYKSLDKLEALIQHNESPLDTWSENEYELNKTYAFDTVSFSEWLTELRKAVLEDTLEKINDRDENYRHMTIEHIAMYVNDLEAARDFFVTYLGGSSNAGYHNEKTGFRSYFISFDDGPRLELMNKPEVEDLEKPLNRTGYVHIAFSLGSKENVNELTARLKTAGYEVVSGPRTTGDGYYESCIVVFEGNQIELTE